ncbi:MAG: RecQ family ATP-dependent DNA helicase [Bacteroidaceae bacterium]|nr:RecQ family ATP-dependent DNA helicase [Bacteroidaceae bacterium]
MERFLSILHKYWGYTSFRGIQEDIIKSVAAGQDTLGLMPTGGGKSITFQVPTMAMEGICIVVTPLIALMKDQVDNLKRRGIAAAAIHVGLSRGEMLRLLDNCILGSTKFLYVSPERLETDLFLDKVSRMNVCLLTVDEAHCISQWGYDFRPAYLRIAQLRKHLPHVPVLALTATATPQVVSDIERLLRNPFTAEQGSDNGFHRFVMSFARPNLRYVVRPTEDPLGEIDHILRSVSGSAIVYTRSRKGAQDMASKLVQMGHTAVYYHAGLTPLDKDTRQRMWVDDEFRVMVATNAFGMGIDKPDVRLVIHADLPDCIEAYFQEAGRAGRDGETAYAVCLSSHNDGRTMKKRLADQYPNEDYIRSVYEALGSFFQLAVGDGLDVTYEFDIGKFCRAFRFYPSMVEGALSILTQAGYIYYREDDAAHSRILFLTERDELYRLKHLPPLSERIIGAILRTTTGVFSEYATIFEKDIAERVQCTPEEVYETLKALTRQRILHYIPTKHVPFITFTRRREETRHLALANQILNLRKIEATKRAEKMLNYTLDKSQCHSQYLLSYLGETKSPPCRHCDICLSQKKNKRWKELADKLMALLQDKGQIPLEKFRIAGYDSPTHHKAIQHLVSEERIFLNQNSVFIKQ